MPRERIEPRSGAGIDAAQELEFARSIGVVVGAHQRGHLGIAACRQDHGGAAGRVCLMVPPQRREPSPSDAGTRASAWPVDVDGDALPGPVRPIGLADVVQQGSPHQPFRRPWLHGQQTARHSAGVIAVTPVHLLVERQLCRRQPVFGEGVVRPGQRRHEGAKRPYRRVDVPGQRLHERECTGRRVVLGGPNDGIGAGTVP